MATKGERNERLLVFLKESFTPREFQRILKLKGFDAVAEVLDSNFECTRVLLRRDRSVASKGPNRAEFFARVADERPAKREQVRNLEAFWNNQGQVSPEASADVLAEHVKSAKTLVDLTLCIGNALSNGDYNADQAEEICLRYVTNYDNRYSRVKILGMAEPVALASIYTEVRIVPPTFLYGYRSSEELQEEFLRKGRRTRRG